MKDLTLIGEYEVSYDPDGEPALVIHHLIRGYDVLRMDAAAAAALGELLGDEQKRIRGVGGYQLIFGAGGDLACYAPNGQRACYFNAGQAAQLAALLLR